MRTDENGNPCPSTLGEYRDLMCSLTSDTADPVLFLDAKIAATKEGRNAEVIASDLQMRLLLYSMVIKWVTDVMDVDFPEIELVPTVNE